MKEEVILVNELDQPIGVMEKLSAHEEGRLHRAISVFIFNTKGEMLLQKRAFVKYHCGGLWTNAACSHPRVGETVLEAANRRLMEEMGLQCNLKQAFSFMYKAELSNQLIEHEYDYVFIGICDELPVINHLEVDSYAYFEIEALKTSLLLHPEKYTPWFKIAIQEVLQNQPKFAKS